ncbi:MAG TPA: nickel pincer cofactor biosynthesis protein LarB [Firmicutes bacterium]|nr:nickel pincer cofactor biosynthesis protein LarB [Bacillota bacterium]
MKDAHFSRLLYQVQQGEISVEQALQALRHLPYEDLGFAKIDHHRRIIKGYPEVIYCPGKTISQIVAIAERLQRPETTVLATRANQEVFRAIHKIVPRAEFHPEARAVVIPPERPECLPRERGCVGVITAGTADLPVAQEAALVSTLMGSRVERLFDVGVAGLHRLLDNFMLLERARVLVVVAGMDGVLAGVVGGPVSCPVIAVPTSTGYGASFGGLAPLLTMLNCCAPGVAVVNIDNGFGAGYMAALINRQGEDES